MDVIQFMVENKALVISIGVVLVIILAFICKIEGFVLLLKQAIGMVLQQLCSLVIEAICLVFKIINSLEIYVVLLIDALTGRTSSNGKIASLAIGVLSIASFYTTYSGMHYFIEQKPVAFLITLGIQAILLSTSLRINEVLNLDAPRNNFFLRRKLIITAGIVCMIACILAYLSPIFGMSYSVSKGFYHIIYILIIVLALIMMFLIIMELIKTGIKNSNVGVFLFVIYFAVLAVSSFFSYNAFVPIMYPEQIRDIDTLQTYRLGVIGLLERVNDAVDNDYYESVQVEIETELQKLEDTLAVLGNEFFLTEEEKKIYRKKAAIEEYAESKKALAEKEDEYKKEEDDWQIEEETLFKNSGGVGVNTKEVWTEMNNAHKEKLANINTEMQELQKSINRTASDIKQNEEDYLKTLQKIEVKKQDYDCTEEFDLVNKLLRFDTWTQDEENDFREAVLKLENVRLNFPKNSKEDTDKGVLSNNLWDMVEVYRGYQMYRNRYSEIESQILNISVETGSEVELYEQTYNQIQSYVYELLGCLPETKYTFFDSDNSKLHTKDLPKSNYYSTVESLKRNANPGLSQIEKNMRTFINNKMVGVTCSLMALLIDMMILFVGIILPKDVQFYNNPSGKYSEQEIKRILSNLFNKPIKR